MKHLLLIIISAIFIFLASFPPAHAFPPAPVAQTGQTFCYDAANALTDCAGTGQDGEFQSGYPWPSPRFSNNGDQTITDNLTGLIWSKDANPAGAGKNWQGALDYIKSLNLANYLGHNDWRLPNRNELASITNKSQSNLSVWLMLSEQGFANVQAGRYWSSSTDTHSNDYAWYIGMVGGDMYFYYKNYDGYVWPVRYGYSESFASSTIAHTGQTLCYDAAGAVIDCAGTGQDGEFQAGYPWPSPRFIDNSLSNINDKTITDNLTGLIWAKDANPAGVAKTWQGALDYIKSLNLTYYQGYSDWRLPNLNELESLVHEGKSNSFVWLNLAEQGFAKVQSDTYWSSSTSVGSYRYAWYVDMNDGSVTSYNKEGNRYVWPVRSGQFWAFDPLIISAAPKFGTQFSGVPAPPRLVEISNRGSSEQTITAVALSGVNQTEFSLASGGSNPCSLPSPTLTAGGGCTLLLGFNLASTGAKNASLDITVNSKTSSIPLSGSAISTVYGMVTDQANGLPVSGATVILDTAAIATTSGFGNYNLGDLPAATYSISVSKSGYQTVSRSGLVVTATTSAKADILLPTVGTLNITSTSLPWASPNVAYSSRVMVAGGTAPYTFSRPYGNLPTGISIDSATGTISGTPTGSGSYTFAIGVTDSVAGYVEKEFTIDLLSPLQITPESLPAGQQGVAYNSSISASGGKPAYTFNLVGGTLPNGITLSSSGTITGTPREAGTFNITVRLTDSTARTLDKSYTLSLAAAPLFPLNTTTLPSGVIANFYTKALSASGGVTPYTFSIAETLPAGLALNSANGTISGTPTAAGLTNLTISVTDNSYPTPQTVTKTLPLRIWSSQPYTFSVTMAGTGSGSVTSDSGGMACTGGTCSAELPGNSTVNLFATPSYTSLFGSWSGDCSGTGDCSFYLNANKAVTATFTAAPKAKVGSKPFTTLQSAYDDQDTTNGSIIKLLEGPLANTLSVGRPISVKLEGGYSAAYNPTSNETVIQGPVRINSGTVRMKGVKVK